MVIVMSSGDAAYNVAVKDGAEGVAMQSMASYRKSRQKWLRKII